MREHTHTHAHVQALECCDCCVNRVVVTCYLNRQFYVTLPFHHNRNTAGLKQRWDTSQMTQVLVECTSFSCTGLKKSLQGLLKDKLGSAFGIICHVEHGTYASGHTAPRGAVEVPINQMAFSTSAASFGLYGIHTQIKTKEHSQIHKRSVGDIYSLRSRSNGR